MQKKGFTLIELLIVITIIGVLAVALLPRITGIPAKGRDTARITALSQIATALETYYSEKGSYPSDNSTFCLNPSTVGGPGEALKKYLGGDVPKDPSTSNGFAADGNTCKGYFYYKGLKNESNVANSGYMILANTEQDVVGANYYKYTTAIAATTVAGAQAALAVTADTGAENVYGLVR